MHLEKERRGQRVMETLRKQKCLLNSLKEKQQLQPGVLSAASLSPPPLSPSPARGTMWVWLSVAGGSPSLQTCPVTLLGHLRISRSRSLRPVLWTCLLTLPWDGFVDAAGGIGMK